MLRGRESGNGESLRADGDIKRAAGHLLEAVVSYLNAYVVDPHGTQLHLLDSLVPPEKDNVVRVLQDWLKTDSAENLRRRCPGVKNVANEIWKFIFTLDPGVVDTCIAQIESQMKEKRYKQVVDVCSAIIDHLGNDAASILIQRAIAYTLMDGFNKQAVSDCLRAFAKDKEGAVQVLRNKHGAHYPQITELLRAFVHSKPIGSENRKSEKWLKLTTDCCKLLLAMDTTDFQLQMTYVERLTTWNKLDQAIATLNESIRVLYHEVSADTRKLAECWIRLGYCYVLKPQTDIAISNITRGLNLPIDSLVEAINKANAKRSEQQPEYDITKTFLEDNYEVQHVGRIAREILNSSSAELNDVVSTLDKISSRLNSPEKSTSNMSLNSNVHQVIDYYRAILVVKPRHRDTLLKLAACYSKIGRHNFAIKIYDHLLSRKDYAQDSVILSARAVCYRETGKKNEARKDYDNLLRHSPKDPTLLFERALVHLENEDIDALLIDLEAACRSNQRTVSIYMNKLPTAQRTRIRQMLYDRAKKLLQYAQHPTGNASPDTNAGSMALSISQLLTKLNSKDRAAHILKAHAFYYIGNYDDAEVTLKRLLDNNPENSDNHIVKLHLGLLLILMKDTEKGIAYLTKVVQVGGEEMVSNFLQEIPPSQRTFLYSSIHGYAVTMLRTKRDDGSVRRAIHCFTIAVLCCLAGPTNSSEVLFSHGLCKSYLARAECHAHLGDQGNAIRDFTSALEVNPVSVDALCGRAFMRLALGDEHGCVNDIVQACGVATPTVTAHIGMLPQDAKRILLHWLDQHVLSLLLAYGSRDGLMLNGRRESSISITVETAKIFGHIPSPSSDSSSETTPVSPEAASPYSDVSTASADMNFYAARDLPESSDAVSPFDASSPQDSASSPTKSENTSMEAMSVFSSYSNHSRNTTSFSSTSENTMKRKRRGFHKSSAGPRKVKPSLREFVQVSEELDSTASSSHGSSMSGATFSTQTSLSCDDVIGGVERTERLLRAQMIGKLLIAVDPGNPLRHGMYADIFILKGEFEEGLRHLEIVMELSPNDVTAVARAGLICAKQNRYEDSAGLLSSLVDVDWGLLLYVLKSLDSTVRRRLSEECHLNAGIMCEEDDFRKAVEYLGLSLVASDHKRLEKLRQRALCFMKLKNNKQAMDDMATVIKEAGAGACAMDYCARGHVHLMDNRDKEACSDYSRALKINCKQATLLIHAKPGLAPLSRVFQRQALNEFTRHDFERCLQLCEDGILIDNNNIDLKKLRARARKEIGYCVVQ